MDIKKCDRCGEYYTPFKEYGTTYCIKPTGLMFIFDDIYSHSPMEKYDLCPECIKEIENFIKNR